MPLDDSLQLTTQIEGAKRTRRLPSIASTTVDTSVSGSRAGARARRGGARVRRRRSRSRGRSGFRRSRSCPRYQRLYFPQQRFPSSNFGVNNWTVGLQTSFPILDGGRIKGDQLIAQAGVKQARAQREQTRQFAALDTRVALNPLAEAQATWDASRGTAEQAQKTYAIDQVRFREGISTQTDLYAVAALARAGAREPRAWRRATSPSRAFGSRCCTTCRSSKPEPARCRLRTRQRSSNNNSSSNHNNKRTRQIRRRAHQPAPVERQGAFSHEWKEERNTPRIDHPHHRGVVVGARDGGGVQGRRRRARRRRRRRRCSSAPRTSRS